MLGARYRETFEESSSNNQKYLSVVHTQPSHRVFIDDIEESITTDVMSVLAPLDAYGLTVVRGSKGPDALRKLEKERGYTHVTYSRLIVADALSASISLPTGSLLVVTLFDSYSVLLLFAGPSMSSASSSSTLRGIAAEKGSSSLVVHCVGQVSAGAVSILEKLMQRQNNKKPVVPAMTLITAPRNIDPTVTADTSSKLHKYDVLAVWGSPEFIRVTVNAMGSNTSAGVRCLQYTDVDDTADLMAVSPSVLPSDVDVKNILPDARIGVEPSTRVMAVFKSYTSILTPPSISTSASESASTSASGSASTSASESTSTSASGSASTSTSTSGSASTSASGSASTSASVSVLSADPALSAPIIRSTFLSLSNSEDGADHVGMTNLTLWQESLKISPAVKDALAHANEKLMGGSVFQEKTTETFDVGEGRRQPDSIGGYYDSDDAPLLIVPPSNLEMRLVRTELLFHRGRRVDRHRTWLASVGGDSAIVRAGDVVVLEQQVDARRNGSYYVLDVTSSTWLLTTHWVLREENSNSDSNEKSDSVSVVNVDLRARRAQVIVNRGGHRVRWWRGSPCIIRLRSSSSASTAQTFLVGRIDSFDMVKNTLVVDIVSAQPTDRVSDEDAVVEDDMFGSGIMETSEDILQIAIDLIRRSQTYEPKINLVKPEISEKPDVGQTIISNTNNEPENTDPDGFVHVDASSYAVGTFKGSPEKDQVSRDPLDPVSRDPHDPYYCGSNPSVSGSSLVNTTGSSALLSIEYAEFAQKYLYLFRMCTNVPSPESADNLIKILPMMLRQLDSVIVAEGQGGLKGSYQYGFFKELYAIRPTVRINRIFGASVGSLNAAPILLRRMDILDMYWRNRDGKHPFDQIMVPHYNRFLVQGKNSYTLKDNIWRVLRNGSIFTSLRIDEVEKFWWSLSRADMFALTERLNIVVYDRLMNAPVYCSISNVHPVKRLEELCVYLNASTRFPGLVRMRGDRLLDGIFVGREDVKRHIRATRDHEDDMLLVLDTCSDLLISADDSYCTVTFGPRVTKSKVMSFCASEMDIDALIDEGERDARRFDILLSCTTNRFNE
eukprot:gene27552-biopygen5865